ncbi:hypothetical protein ACHQM5_001459 [Ranunculus cassubicifolius]
MATITLRERMQQSVTPTALRSYFAEFISTFIFVFAVVGSTMSSQKLVPNALSDPACLVAIALASTFGLSTAVYVSATISGGHVNPAVTFGLAVGGHISILTAIFYWISQLLGSIMACLVLKVCTAGNAVPASAIAEEMTGFGASVMEGVMTFTLVYTVYAGGDPRRGSLGIIGPLAIGCIVGANVLASGPFSGGSMNPACSFGSAVVSGNFKNQGVYWAGPLIGAAVGGLLYENVVFPQSADSSGGGGRGGNQGIVV